MSVIRAHKIRLISNTSQDDYFYKACGVSRFSYNWALSWWEKEYEKYKNGEREKAPNGSEASRELNKIKREQFPWMLEVTKCAPNQAIKNLHKSYQKFFSGGSNYPKFKCKKYSRLSFTVDCPPCIQFGYKKVRIPNLGWVRLAEDLRFKGKILNCTVSYKAGHWYISVPVELEEDIKPEITKDIVGVDVGVREYVMSDGTRAQVPRSYRAAEKSLKRAHQDFSRKQKGSKNREKAKLKLQKKYEKTSNIRNDWLHNLTKELSKYQVVAIEDLNVSGMLSNHCLAKSISDAGFYEFRRQLEYKCNKVVTVDRFFPSSKLCNVCGIVRAKLPLNIRTWVCGCGTTHDRDLNAAINILNEAGAALSGYGEFP